MSDAPQEPLETELLPRPEVPADSGDPASPVQRPPTAPARELPGSQLGLTWAERRWALILFTLTVVSTFYAGTVNTANQHRLLLRDRQTGQVLEIIDRHAMLIDGAIYCAGVIGILVFHEMGHYLQARRYRVPASPPYFIPMPITPLGTMGAVIFQQPDVADRKMLFDIAISGPLAGLVVALPLAWWGVQRGVIVTAPPGYNPGFNDPLILRWLIDHFFGPLQPNQDILVNPVYFAAWVGILLTAVNLVPMGQLDGGHILYCLLGRRAHKIAVGLFAFAVGAAIYNIAFGDKSYLAWLVMLGLVFFGGIRHLPTSNDSVPLGPVRIILGWITLAFVVIGFTPSPFRF